MASKPKTLKLLREFIDQKDLVEFGNYRSDDDNIDHILGITHLKSHENILYAHGTHEGYREYSVLLRKFNLGQDETVFTWVILRFILNISNAPRLFLDTHQAGNLFYKELLESFNLFSHVTEAVDTEKKFNNNFHIFSSLQDSITLNKYLDYPTLEKFVLNFPSLSFELTTNQLLIYSDVKHLSALRLDNMLKCGLWLSERFEYISADQQEIKP